jgi:hypothetical protein
MPESQLQRCCEGEGMAGDHLDAAAATGEVDERRVAVMGHSKRTYINKSRMLLGRRWRSA